MGSGRHVVHHAVKIHKTTRAHPAHPTAPAHIRPHSAQQPKFESAQKCLNDLMLSIDCAKDQWEAFGHNCASAYSVAWQSQAATLREVKEAHEKRLKAEEAEAVFALNLLTVGIAGGISAHIGKQFSEGVKIAAEKLKPKLKEFLTEASEAAMDYGHDLAKERMAKANEKLYKAFGHPEPADAFTPVGTDPLQFAEDLQQGISISCLELHQMARDLNAKINADTPIQGIQRLRDTIVNMPFIRQPPSTELSKGLLVKKAALILWISWAWRRDAAYWRIHSHSVDSGSRTELAEFEPVRAALFECGVPAARINQQFVQLVDLDRLNELKKAQEAEDLGHLKMIDMDAFIRWANSDDIIHVLFSGIDTSLNMEWLYMIPAQLALRRALPPGLRGG